MTLLAGLAMLALWRRRLGRVGRWALAALLCAAAALQLAAVLVLSFLDRPLDLYFDLPQLPSLLGLFRDAVGPWRELGATALALLCAAALLAAAAWAIAVCARAMQRPRAAMAVLSVAVPALCIGAVAHHAKDRTLVAFAAPDAVAE